MSPEQTDFSGLLRGAELQASNQLKILEPSFHLAWNQRHAKNLHFVSIPWLKSGYGLPLNYLVRQNDTSILIAVFECPPLTKSPRPVGKATYEITDGVFDSFLECYPYEEEPANSFFRHPLFSENYYSISLAEPIDKSRGIGSFMLSASICAASKLNIPYLQLLGLQDDSLLMIQRSGLKYVAHPDLNSSILVETTHT